RASLINIPAQCTLQPLGDLVPGAHADRIKVIAPGSGAEFRPQALDDASRQAIHPALSTPYILFVGTIEPRKNLERLVESYRRLVTESAVVEHLVLAGRLGWEYANLLRQIESPDLRGRVHVIG